MKIRPRYLLDTNVISELRRGGAADPRVTSFLARAGTPALFFSVLTLGELRQGAARQRSRDRVFADRLTAWIDKTEQDFADRLLGVDLETANMWGELSASRTLPIIDSLLAATAVAQKLTLVTRSTKDFAGIDIDLLNPWSSETTT